MFGLRSLMQITKQNNDLILNIVKNCQDSINKIGKKNDNTSAIVNGQKLELEILKREVEEQRDLLITLSENYMVVFNMMSEIESTKTKEKVSNLEEETSFMNIMKQAGLGGDK